MYGYNVSALMRNFMNLAGIPWKDCEKYGRLFDDQITTADWLSTDNGKAFEPSYNPTREEQKNDVPE